MCKSHNSIYLCSNEAANLNNVKYFNFSEINLVKYQTLTLIQQLDNWAKIYKFLPMILILSTCHYQYLIYKTTY